jgi:hypothetical protein
MPTQIISSFPTHFQQIFAAFCLLIADSCIFLSFQILASKSTTLLITNAASKNKKSKPFQTNIDSNVAIRTFEIAPASKHTRQKTNHFKPSTISVGTRIYPVRELLSLRAANLCFSFSLRLCLKRFAFVFVELLTAEMLRRAVTSRRRHKPNPKGIFV